MTLIPFEHQLRTVAFQATNERVFDTSDPGTGKTGSAILAFNARRMRGGGAALIIAPKSILRSAWQADFKKFAPHLVTSIASAEHREDAFEAPADAYIINHDAARWLAKRPADFFSKFDTLIIDESGAYKHNTSQRSKAIVKIKSYFKYRLLMNGTPNPNSVLELWNQLNILDDGQRLGKSFYSFRQAVCVPKQVGPAANMIQWADRPGAQEAIAKRIEDITIRHKFEDCIDIPPNFAYSVPYYFPPAQAQAYEEMRVAAVALVNNSVISAVNAAAVATKLLQISSGAVYSGPGVWHLVDPGRYELVMDLVEERTFCVVFFLWEHQRECLIEEAQKRGITFGVIDGSVNERKRAETVDYFQKGLYRVIFAHPQSAAHGLTLTRGTTTIWASPTYNLEHYLQGLRRIYRAGQVFKTETITVVADGTIEERVQAALDAKALNMESLLEILRSV